MNRINRGETRCAQTVPLSGKIISWSVTFKPTATNHNSAIVNGIPPTDSFILTQFCRDDGNAILSDSTFGFIAAAYPDSCVSFSPDIKSDKSAQIGCTTQPSILPSSACWISGVLGP
jgi:hypothetical protein